MFVVNTKSLFSILGELRKNDKKKSDSFWNTFYVDFFYELAKSEHLETFCKYITQAVSEDSTKWLTENKDKLDAFDAWLQE